MSLTVFILLIAAFYWSGVGLLWFGLRVVPDWVEHGTTPRPLAYAAGAIRWLLGEVWEKVNVVGTFRELRAAGRKYGRRFFIAAVVWELIEDVAFPLVSWRCGHPELIPFFLVFHFEPIIYPVLFWAFRTWDRYRGREPWEPARPVMSSNSRSIAKVGTHQLISIVCFWAIFSRGAPSWWPLVIYSIMMTGFKYVHERIWHDSGWGIRVDDSVQLRRVFAKATTYRCVSIAVMVMMYNALGSVPTTKVATYQIVTYFACLLVELAWRRSKWGLQPTGRMFMRPGGPSVAG